MKETPYSIGAEAIAASDNDGLELRILCVMVASVALAVSVGALLAPWRVTTGLLLGGLLSLLNYRWMRTSIAALVETQVTSKNTSAKVSRYILRYFVIAAVVIVAYALKVVSLPATIIGLCSFVVALFAEAFRQVYFTIVHREGIN
jgi:hypothetical protein